MLRPYYQVPTNSAMPVSVMLRAGRLKKWREGRGRSFYPPLDTPFSVGIAWRSLKRILWKAARIREVSIDGLARMTSLHGQPAIITPNHPTNLDPLVLFELSRQAREPFNYLASRESFSVPGIGWVLQKCGAYSIMRGVVDRTAIKTTRALLSGGKKIVMFPEGLTYGQNDMLMPFHEGVVQFGFWALDDMKGAGPLWIVPVGLKYRYTRPMNDDIVLAVWRLEKHLGIEVDLAKPIYERLRAVGIKVVEGFERAYGVRPERQDTLDQRIHRMKEVWISRTAAALGVKDDPTATMGDRIREIINALDRMTIALDASEFTKQTMRRRHQETLPLYRDMDRAGRFLATGAHYIAEAPTDERFLEVINRLEEELFGFSPMRGPRKASLKIGEPFDLRTYYEEYKSDPRGTVRMVTERLEREVKTLLSISPDQ